MTKTTEVTYRRTLLDTVTNDSSGAARWKELADEHTQPPSTYVHYVGPYEDAFNPGTPLYDIIKLEVIHGGDE